MDFCSSHLHANNISVFTQNHGGEFVAELNGNTLWIFRASSVDVIFTTTVSFIHNPWLSFIVDTRHKWINHVCYIAITDYDHFVTIIMTLLMCPCKMLWKCPLQKHRDHHSSKKHPDNTHLPLRRVFCLFMAVFPKHSFVSSPCIIITCLNLVILAPVGSDVNRLYQKYSGDGLPIPNEYWLL